MTLWIPLNNKDHVVDFEKKQVLKGTKTFNQLVIENLSDTRRSDRASILANKALLEAHYGITIS